MAKIFKPLVNCMGQTPKTSYISHDTTNRISQGPAYMVNSITFKLHIPEQSHCFLGLSQCLRAHPWGPSIPHVSHQEPQQLGVILVTVAHTVLIAFPLVFLHHLEKHNILFSSAATMGNKNMHRQHDMPLIQISLLFQDQSLQSFYNLQSK